MNSDVSRTAGSAGVATPIFDFTKTRTSIAKAHQAINSDFTMKVFAAYKASQATATIPASKTESFEKEGGKMDSSNLSEEAKKTKVKVEMIANILVESGSNFVKNQHPQIWGIHQSLPNAEGRFREYATAHAAALVAEIDNHTPGILDMPNFRGALLTAVDVAVAAPTSDVGGKI